MGAIQVERATLQALTQRLRDGSGHIGAAANALPAPSDDYGHPTLASALGVFHAHVSGSIASAYVSSSGTGDSVDAAGSFYYDLDDAVSRDG